MKIKFYKKTVGYLNASNIMQEAIDWLISYLELYHLWEELDDGHMENIYEFEQVHDLFMDLLSLKSSEMNFFNQYFYDKQLEAGKPLCPRCVATELLKEVCNGGKFDGFYDYTNPTLKLRIWLETESNETEAQEREKEKQRQKAYQQKRNEKLKNNQKEGI